MPVAVRTLIFTVFVPGSATVGIPALLLLSGAELVAVDLGPFRFIGALPIALGASIYAWCAADFALVGGGTPAPIDAPRTLVSRGLYRVVRNPMYVGVELVLLGEVLVFESLTLAVYAICLWAVFHTFIVLVEEPGLRRSFGAAYEEYCRTVPRWVPRISVEGRR